MAKLEMSCNDTILPIEIDAVKNFLRKIHETRRTMLESLMGALQEGRGLLEKLREIEDEGTLDSRPDWIQVEARRGDDMLSFHLMIYTNSIHS